MTKVRFTATEQQLTFDGTPVEEAQGALFDRPAPAPLDVVQIGACSTCGASTKITGPDPRCDRCHDLGVTPGHLTGGEDAST